MIIPLFFSCRKELGKPSWDTSVVTPLINTSLGINNIVADSLVKYNSDNTVSLVYDYTYSDTNLDTMINLTSTITQQGWAFPFAINAPPGITLFNNTYDTKLQIDQVQLSNICLKSGQLLFDLKNGIKQNLIVNYSIPGATLNNTPFAATISVPADNGISQGLYSGSYDISGYSFNLAEDSVNKYNTIISRSTAMINQKGDTVLIKPSDSLLLSVKLQNIKIAYARGYFGSENIASGTETSNIDYFRKITNGTIGLEKVKLSVDIINYVGVDAFFTLKNLTSFNSRTNTSVALTGQVVGSNITISRAAETGNPLNPVQSTEHIITFENTNIKALFENLPDKLIYSFNILTNPLGNISSGNDFFYSDYGFKIKMNLEIPLSFIASNLTLTDTTAFQINNTSANPIKEGNFTLIAENGFPFDANVQLYLLDQNHHLLDSLLTTNYIAPAPLDINQKVLNPTQTDFVIHADKNKLNNIYNTTYIVTVARFNTSGSQYIKIYKDYKLNIKLCGDFNSTVSF